MNRRKIKDLNLALKIALLSHYTFISYRCFLIFHDAGKDIKKKTHIRVSKLAEKVFQEMTKEEINIYSSWQLSHMYDVNFSKLLLLQKTDIDSYVEMLQHYDLWDLMNYG